MSTGTIFGSESEGAPSCPDRRPSARRTISDAINDLFEEAEAARTSVVYCPRCAKAMGSDNVTGYCTMCGADLPRVSKRTSRWQLRRR